MKKEPNILVELSLEQLDIVEEKAAYLTTEQIADYLGIHRSTFYNVRQRQPEVSRRYQMGKSQKIARFAEQLEKKAFGEVDKGDSACIMFFLKTQGRWAEAKEDLSIENQTIETPEEKSARMEKTKEYTEYLNDTEWHAKKAKQLASENK